MIPEDAADRMARKLREIGVVDRDDHTMPFFFPDTEQGRHDGRGIRYWGDHHEVARQLVDEVRSWQAEVETPRLEDLGEWCELCGTNVTGSHYHCHKCGGRTGMMGHSLHPCPPKPTTDFHEEDESVTEVVQAFEQGEKGVTAEVVRSLGWKPCNRWYAHEGHRFWTSKGEERGPWMCPGRPCSRRESHERHVMPHGGHTLGIETCPGRP